MLSTRQSAKELGVHEKTIYYWIKQNKLNAIKIGRNYKIEESEIAKVKKDGLK